MKSVLSAVEYRKSKESEAARKTYWTRAWVDSQGGREMTDVHYERGEGYILCIRSNKEALLHGDTFEKVWIPDVEEIIKQLS